MEWSTGYLYVELWRRGKVSGKHVKLNAVHEDDGEDMEVLNHIEAPDHPINHLAYPAFVVKGFTDRHVTVFLLVRL